MINTINEILKDKKKYLKERFSVQSIGIFGSYVRNEAGKDSDIDILVEFNKPIDFFDFLDLEEYLSELLGVKVDLVEKQSLKPRIGRRILEEVVMI